MKVKPKHLHPMHIQFMYFFFLYSIHLVKLVSFLNSEFGSFWITEMQKLKDSQDHSILSQWIQKLSITNGFDSSLLHLSFNLLDMYNRDLQVKLTFENH